MRKRHGDTKQWEHRKKKQQKYCYAFIIISKARRRFIQSRLCFLIESQENWVNNRDNNSSSWWWWSVVSHRRCFCCYCFCRSRRHRYCASNLLALHSIRINKTFWLFIFGWCIFGRWVNVLSSIFNSNVSSLVYFVHFSLYIHI